MKKYDKGSKVRDLQLVLNILRYNCKSADGIFGDMTEAAVRAFQFSHGVKVDGIVGPLTQAVLDSVFKIKHFLPNEFRCKCCNQLPILGMDKSLLIRLEVLRSIIGDKPIIIVSGYRCKDHNTNISGAKNSQHMYGRAADIRAYGIDLRTLERYAEEVFKDGGLGLGGMNIVHVDTRGYRARWRYD